MPSYEKHVTAKLRRAAKIHRQHQLDKRRYGARAARRMRPSGAR
jgi:hypothetical protein